MTRVRRASFEVKLRSQVSESDVGDFRYFKQHLPDLAAGAVICLAPERRPLTRDVEVIPVGDIA